MNCACFPKEKTPEFTKMGEIHELFVLALSLVGFAGGTPEIRWIHYHCHTGDPVSTQWGFAQKKGVYGTKKRADSPSGRGARKRYNMETTIWCMFDSP